jgi:hypothetical protein
VGGAVTSLEEFQNHWRENHNPGDSAFVERDVAHLLSSRGVNGWANETTLCNYDNGFSISGGNARLPTLAQNLVHDVYTVAHEIGHNFSGMHTHCFDPPIDKCGVESGCNLTQDCTNPTGTLMSYCHQCPGGNNNVIWQFHASNITRMRIHVIGSCLRVACNPCYVDQSHLGFENGSAAYPYNTIKEGVESVYPGGTVIISGGNYDEPITIWQPMRLEASNSDVHIGQ